MSNKKDPVDTLRQLIQHRTYGKTKSDGTKETVSETIARCEQMHVDKFSSQVEPTIVDAFTQVYDGRVVPSMRTFQFAGQPILNANARAYNCAFSALTKWQDFGDLFYLLMCGCGTGYSVQKHHVAQLPVIDVTGASLGTGEKFYVEDDKEGWADAAVALLYDPSIEFDTSKVRKKGEPLSSGGTASGPEALVKALAEIRTILHRAHGRKLRPIEAHDIMCHIADGVVVGGVRRAALISLFNADDQEMLNCKTGMWWESNPQRARSNNSAVLVRDHPHFSVKLAEVLDTSIASGCGEPGISLTNNKDLGYNPCHEISLKDGQLCNLTEVNVAACDTKEEFIAAVTAATVIGTLQASYTDFTYIQPKWKINCEEEALLGVSLTGQAQKWSELTTWLQEIDINELVTSVNDRTALLLGINPAARITTTKPSGSTSAWLGTTSGIHAAHSSYFIRRVRVDKSDPIVFLLSDSSFVEPDLFNPDNVIISIPIAAPDAITRESETALELLERCSLIYNKWIKQGHVTGDNTHNVSLTVSYKPEEAEDIKTWMLANSDNWAGISLLPFDGGSYVQAPFETISEDIYRLLKAAFDIPDLTDADYTGRIDERLGEVSCDANGCEIT
jgi:ribonucleoside-triphosphate reductase